ncbi:MAG: dephospho-CoA kinase, partial [Acidobacteria bacterium]|nr:dephospho-CoA kinase [Acidobacteriota bacterium]
MLRVGVTGGSACGKTTVAKWFAGLGAVVIDADAIARRLLRPGLPAFRETVEAFGPGILAQGGGID